MRILYTLLLSLFCLISVDAQVLIEPDALDLVLGETSIFTYNIVVTNKESEDKSLHWKVIKGSDFPSEWKTTLCDLNLCYDENTDESFFNRPNFIAAGTSQIFTLKLDPSNVKGSSTLAFQLFADENFEELVAETASTSVITADALLSSPQEGHKSSLIIFPNPADNYFAVQNDSKVKRVNIYNIIGKLVRSDIHFEGQSHNIANLRKGIYTVRLLDDHKKSIKVLRLSKR